MAYKSCPVCKTRYGARKKVCTTLNCNYKFVEDDDDDFQDNIPERMCSICNEVFRPTIIKRSASGQPYYVWHYNNYCSTSCFEISEEKLFDFVFELLRNNKISELPKEISKIVNLENFKFRKTDDLNVNYANFIKLISPQRKFGSEKISSPEDFEEKFGKKPPKKSEIKNEDSYNEEEESSSFKANLSLDKYLDYMLDSSEGLEDNLEHNIVLEQKSSNQETTSLHQFDAGDQRFDQSDSNSQSNPQIKTLKPLPDQTKPGPGQKKCGNKECGKITGVRKKVCECGFEFPIKS